MFKRKYIKIDELTIQEKRRLIFKLSFPIRIKKYFLSDSFYVEYDERIDHVDKSILQIPAISALATVAWAIGADIYVKELDKTYFQSLNRIKSIMKGWFPNFSFSTQINIEKIVPNKFSNKGCALLFSGGIDSITSYLRHRSEKPQLISIWGNFILPEQEATWQKFKRKVTEFSEQEEVEVHFVKTNVRRLINDYQLGVEFGLEWWGRVSHGLTLLGLCAPLTKNEIGTVLIGSGGSLEEIEYPWGSTPFVDNNLSWADVKIIHDCTEFSRQEKIRYILKKYIKTEGRHPFLRVCNSNARTLSNALNCNKCEKCLRTIAGLVLEDIDPNMCGFKTNGRVFDNLKRSFVNRTLKLRENPGIKLFGRDVEGAHSTGQWKRIQREIPNKIGHNLHNSKEFFEWFRNFDLTTYGLDIEKQIELSKVFEILKIRLFSCVAPIWYCVPRTFQEVIRKVHLRTSKSES